jgi:hypothetical protein
MPVAVGAVGAPPSPPPHDAKLHASGGTQAESTWSEFGVLNVAFAALSFAGRASWSWIFRTCG